MTQPNYDAPQQPNYGAPQQPNYGAPQQPNYGAPQQPNYGAPQVPAYGYAMPMEHPQASTVQILGIVGIFAGILSFVAWYMGGQAKKEIEAGAPYAWDGKLKLGYTLGKIFGIINIVVVALSLILMILGIAVAMSQGAN